MTLQQMIRAFVAIGIDPQVRARIAGVMASLAGQMAGIRWVPPENFHFTLKFLGAVEEARLEALGDALFDAVRPFRRFTIHAKRLGVFPNLKRARVLWVGIEGDELPALAQTVENVLEPFGFPRENRVFQPHLTVGRWRDYGAPSTALGEILKRVSDLDFGSSMVDEVVLFQSTLKPQGAVYRRLRGARFGGD